jgi:glycosyltransferase involved in cell wall biosynthesis
VAAPDTLTILVPVFNEERTVASVIERLRTVHLPVPREIVVINDGSSDGTRQALDALARPEGTVRVIHVERNADKGAAIRVGLQHAEGRSSPFRTRTWNWTPLNSPISWRRFWRARTFRRGA